MNINKGLYLIVMILLFCLSVLIISMNIWMGLVTICLALCAGIATGFALGIFDE